MQLSARDRTRLKGLHPDLIKVVERAAQITSRPFCVIEGLRSIEQQRKNVAAGASKTMNSRHLTGHAVDVAPLDDNGKLSWAWPLYQPVAKAFKQAAKELNIPIEWGGDWKKFVDGPHFQLPWKQYPTNVPAEVRNDPPATEKPNTLSNSRIVQGSSVAAAGGAGLLTDNIDQIAKADGYLSAGTVLGLILGVLIIGGALYALYARWDDAGRPLPWKK